MTFATVEMTGRPAEGTLSCRELTPALYRELRRIAARHLSTERRDHTLQPTALVHEAYLKLVHTDCQFTGDVHLLAVASRIMRQVLVDHARARTALKRSGGAGGGAPMPAYQEIRDERKLEPLEVIALDDALAALEAENSRLARLIEMRFFGGMTAEESAEALGISVHVVRHDLRFAQAWLRRRIAA